MKISKTQPLVASHQMLDLGGTMMNKTSRISLHPAMLAGDILSNH